MAKSAKIAALILVFIAVTNLILYITGKLNEIVFWGIIIVTALIAYKILPRLKSKIK